MPDTYAHLAPYVRPQYYIGPDYPDTYAVVGQSRDSDALEQSNFRVALAMLGGESDTVFVVRDSHFLVGWIDTLRVSASDPAACATADRIRERLGNYPVLDESDFSDLEWNDAANWWWNMGLSERVRLCRECGLSVFAARREEMPDDDSGRLFERLTRC